jgi:hypothetical protein
LTLQTKSSAHLNPSESKPALRIQTDEDSISKAQMIWSLFVAMAVGFVLFQKHTNAPIREMWAVPPPVEKTPNREVASPILNSLPP